MSVNRAKAAKQSKTAVVVRFSPELFREIEKRLAKSPYPVNREATFREIILAHFGLSTKRSRVAEAASTA